MCWFTCGRREKDVGGKKRGEKKRKWGWGSNGEEEGVPGRDRCVVLCGAGNEVWYSGENHHHTTHHNTFNTQHHNTSITQHIMYACAVCGLWCASYVFCLDLCLLSVLCVECVVMCCDVMCCDVL